MAQYIIQIVNIVKDMKSKEFFAEKGLTSTSANQIANMAKEYVDTYKTALESVRFYDTRVELIDGTNPKQVSFGIKDITVIPSYLDEIAKANSLIAWLREAIKAKEQTVCAVDEFGVEEYCQMIGKVLPTRPSRQHVLTTEEWVENLPANERNRYLYLETQCAVIGKYIHPNGDYAKARKNLKNIIANPCKVEGDGRNTIIRSYTPSVDLEKVEAQFFELQNKHREFQKKLNSMKYDCEKAIAESQTDSDAKYAEDLAIYNNAIEAINAEYKVYWNQQMKLAKDLKIAIPESLQEIYDKISKLGR